MTAKVDPPKQPQPPALALANADRHLRYCARRYDEWLQAFQNSSNISFDQVDDAHVLLQAAALKFAAAYNKCNGGQ
jgi:hypothetical protein